MAVPSDGGVLRDGGVVLWPLPEGAGGGAAFTLEVGGVAAGQGRVQPAAGRRGQQVEIQLAGVGWESGVARTAIRLLTDHALGSGVDAVFALGVTAGAQGAFAANRYVPFRPGALPGRWDLICRRAYFEGRAAALPHPGPDGVRAADQPHGAMVVVHRRRPALEVLVLHRAGLGEDGDWAWTPPSGARFPAEPIEECAARELLEETGLDGSPVRLAGAGTARWWVYGLEVGADAGIAGGQEHDRHEWVPADEAVRRCRPEAVRVALQAAVAHLAG